MPYFKFIIAIALMAGGAYMGYEIALMAISHFSPEYADYKWNKLLKAFLYCVTGLIGGALLAWRSLKEIPGSADKNND